MKFQSATALLALGLSAAHAQQDQNQTGPFLMHIKGTEPGSTLDGEPRPRHAPVSQNAPN